MNQRKIALKTAAVISSFTFLLHIFGGQQDLVLPLINSNLSIQNHSEWLGVWHMVSIMLGFGSYLLIKGAFGNKNLEPALLKPLAVLYLLLGIPFIISSLYFGVFAPQWILLMPIGALTYWASSKT